MNNVKKFGTGTLLLVLGVLLLLSNLNYLQDTGAVLAVGIVAVIAAVYYIFYGLIEIITGKLPDNAVTVMQILNVFMFAAYLFTSLLEILIDGSSVIGITAWIIDIIGMAVSVILVCMFTASRFNKNSILLRVTRLFAGLFVLVLILNVLFDAFGDPVNIGAINLVFLAIYAIFTIALYRTIGEDGDSEAAPAESTEESAE